MNRPSSPTPPSSPASSLPSSSDDSLEIPQQGNSDFSAMSPSSMPPSVVVSSPFSSSSSSSSSSMASTSAEPSSSTNCSSLPLMTSQNDEALPGGSGSSSHDGIPTAAFPVSLDHCPSSSKSKLDSTDNFHSCSSNHFSSEVSSSNMDVDITPFTSSTHDSSLSDNEAGYLWVPDSSEGAAGPSFSHSSIQHSDACSNLGIPSSSNWQQDIPGAMGETLVSRSTWQVNCSKTDAKSLSESSHWSSEMFPVGGDASDVSSTGPPETDKLTGGSNSCSGWPPEASCCHPEDHGASTSSWQREPVNSSVDVDTSAASWCEDSSEGAVGMSWQCDSPNSTIPGTSVSPSPSSTTLGANISPSPWPPPPLSSSVQSGTPASISSSTQHCPSNPNINSTSAPSGEVNPQVQSWRTRASLSPISLTRVRPTTPPPRPPTPPCPATPPSGRLQGARNQYPPSPRRSVSPQERRQSSINSTSTIRRSVSPPVRHHSHSTPPTPSRRSVSPPLRGRGLAQHLNSPRRSVSPVALQQALAQPPSPTGRHRLSPRPRSARTPSPRPPRPPNSTPEPSPSPSQHSPRPHLAKMRGR